MAAPERARKPLPIDVEDVRRELRAPDARVVLAAASALGALAVRVQLPETYASVVDDLVDALGRLEGERGAQASVLAALSGLCATVPGARERAIERDACARAVTEALDGGRAIDAPMDGPDDATASVCVNALDLFRFMQSESDRRGFECVRGDARIMAFAFAAARCAGGSELDFMKRVGGIDLIVNLAQQCAEDEDAFDSLVREGAFDAFARALQADEDEVVVRGLIGLACALPRRRALRARLAEDGEAVRRLATFMGSSTDESVRGFSGGLFRALAMDPETKGLVEKALRAGAESAASVDTA
jgi:hypothetical protein